MADQIGSTPRIVFMGTPEFAVPSLKALSGLFDVVGVYAQPPRRQGRGMKEKPSAVHAQADALGLCIYTPTQFNDDDIRQLAELAPDFLVVVAYGMILPQAVLDIPAVMPINGHASLLPRWRGAAPIHRAIAAQDDETGITTMKMEAGLDTGPMLMMEKTAINADDDTGSLHDRLAMITADLLVKTINSIGDIQPVSQDDDQVTYAGKITPDEAEIDFTQTAQVIDARLRAFRPFPGSWIALGKADNGKITRLKVSDINLVSAQLGEAGSVLGAGPNGGPLVACCDGAVELTKVQPQGKPSMSGQDFLNGNTLPEQILKADDIVLERV